MANTVFIFGAGASADSGVPVMGNFLEHAERLLRGGTLGEHQEHFQRVFSAIANLRSVHSKAKLNTDNIEEIYTAFEMGRLLKKIPGFAVEQIDELISSLHRVITITIERTQSFEPNALVAHPYGEFAKMLETRFRMFGQSQALITFNYDLGLESGLFNNALDYDYCHDGKVRAGRVPLLKLHGSLNWYEDGIDVKVVEFGELHKAHMPLGQNPYLSVFERLRAISPDAQPLIVPPALAKISGQQKLQNVWIAAAKELSEAETIVIIGYSIPETDTFFRHLFALGTVGEQTLRHTYMVDISHYPYERFANLLSEDLRKKAKHIGNKFGAWMRGGRTTFD